MPTGRLRRIILILVYQFGVAPDEICRWRDKGLVLLEAVPSQPFVQIEGEEWEKDEGGVEERHGLVAVGEESWQTAILRVDIGLSLEQ
jgi:hypothetical protein